MVSSKLNQLTLIHPFIQRICQTCYNWVIRWIQCIQISWKHLMKLTTAFLLKKLYNFDVSSYLLDWILSYVFNRCLNVRVNMSISQDFIVTAEVPQGSHIGSLLFILFFNDIKPSFINTSFLLFADDLKWFKIIFRKSHQIVFANFNLIWIDCT